MTGSLELLIFNFLKSLN